MRHLVIIGGGIAGLTVALRRSRLGDRVTLYEASERLGGQLHTERRDGFLIEHGAEGFVAGSTAVAALAQALGIRDQLLDQRVSESCHFDGQRLIVLEPGQAGRLLGFQVAARAFGKGIQSFAGGMSQVVTALATELVAHAECVRHAPVTNLVRAGSAWDVIAANGATVRASDVIVATGSAAAARLLTPEFGANAAALNASEAVSSVTVSLAYPRESVHHALNATGFVVAEAAQSEGLRACTFASSKLAGRSPEQSALLRVFFRPTPPELAELSDDDWSKRAARAVGRAIPIEGAPSQSWVARWGAALPVFDAAHRERVTALERTLNGTGVWLCGAAFHGSGIDGAVRSAESVTAALAALPV